MKRTLIAVAVLAVASGNAFAYSQSKKPFIFGSVQVSQSVDMKGCIALLGLVTVSSTTGALVNNKQNIWANTTLKPMPSSYLKGKVTTTINSNDFSINASGSSYKNSWDHSSGSLAFNGGFAQSTVSTTHSKSSSAFNNGYQFSAQKSEIGGSFSKSKSNSSAHLWAGGEFDASLSSSSSKSTSSPHGWNKHGNYGNSSSSSSNSVHGEGSLSAGYKLSSKSNSSSLAGSFSSKEGSGQAVGWKSKESKSLEKSTYATAFAGYASFEKKSQESKGSEWGFDKHVQVSNVSTHGSVTAYINTQPATTLTATTGVGAGSGSSGNIGVNITQGVNNGQSNDAALASIDAGNVFGSAQIFSSQSTSGNAHISNYVLNASIGDNSLQNVSGNIGVNVASGIGNAQNNSLAASTSTASGRHATPVAMVATDDNCQTTGMNFSGSMGGSAVLGAGALANSTGNIGVNIAGGVGNAQHNGLAIASMNIKK